DDPAAGGGDALVLLLAEIADANLDQPLDARLADDVVHDRRVRVLEALVRVPQIGVRVEVEDAESGVLGGMRSNGAERDAVVAAYRPYDLAAREPIRARLLYPGIHLAGDRVHDRGLARRWLRQRRLRQHGDAGFVRLPRLEIPEVDLPARAQDGPRAA